MTLDSFTMTGTRSAVQLLHAERFLPYAYCSYLNQGEGSMAKRQMTVNQFFSELEGIEGFYCNGSKIRKSFAGIEYDPLDAVADKVLKRSFGTRNWEKTARHLGLQHSFAKDLIAAADRIWGLTSTQRQYRARMIKALGLSK